MLIDRRRRCAYDFNSEARAVIEEYERIVLSEGDSLMMLNLLENPPAPNARLRAAIARLPKPTRSGEEGSRLTRRAHIEDA